MSVTIKTAKQANYPYPYFRRDVLTGHLAPLTLSERMELDAYGELHGTDMLPRRAIELWEREIMYGHA